nr:transcriptional activator NhaR [Archangium primigenium]
MKRETVYGGWVLASSIFFAPPLPSPARLRYPGRPPGGRPVSWLNYHHLLYFWTVARAGSIAKASQELRLAQPTISAQLKLLEDSLGHKLFERQGRRLVLTDVGRTVLRYADDIFRLGNELTHAVNGLPSGQRLRFAVGVTDVVPKLVAESLLHPAFEAFPDIHITCREGPLPQLLASLALHELDVVLSDTPSSEPVSVRSFNHLLGTCGVSFFAAPRLAPLARGFPRSLEGAPMLLPSEGSSAHRALTAWFEARGVRPLIVGGFDDSALLSAFGQRGHGVFAAPSVIEAEVCRQFNVSVLGRTGDIETGFYAISVERRLRHPAVVAIAERARSHLFG